MCQPIIEHKIKKEQLKGRTIIIEFVGPPGAGKTTNCHCFSETLKENDLMVFTAQDIKNYIKSMSPISKLWLLLKTVFYKFPLLVLYVLVLAFNRIFSANSIYRYIRLSIFDFALTQFVKNRHVDFILLDQWVIQEMWSATIFKLKSHNYVEKYLKMFYFKVDFLIYFDIDLATASERIEMRKTNLSRFDKMNSKKRLEELGKYNNYLFKLFENSDCVHKYVLNTQQSPRENANIFCHYLEEILKIKLN